MSALGCGGGDAVSGSAPAPAATAPATTGAPAITATGPSTETETEPTATTGAPTSGSSGGTTAPAEDQPGGAGDEEGVRVPAAFRIRQGSASPSTVSVPAFLAVELRLTSADGRPHTVVVGDGGVTISVDLAAGGTAVRRIEGRRAGDLAVVVDGHRAGTLRIGADPGP